jgi:hypothetical protein
MLDLTQKYQRNPNIVIKSIGGKQVALNTDIGSEYKLNEVSYDMLEVLSQPITMNDFVATMLDKYNVSRERFTADCETWLADALQKELIQKSA